MFKNNKYIKEKYILLSFTENDENLKNGSVHQCMLQLMISSFLSNLKYLLFIKWFTFLTSSYTVNTQHLVSSHVLLLVHILAISVTSWLWKKNIYKLNLFLQQVKLLRH